MFVFVSFQEYALDTDERFVRLFEMRLHLSFKVLFVQEVLDFETERRGCCQTEADLFHIKCDCQSLARLRMGVEYFGQILGDIESESELGNAIITH